ncbi:MAG: hypothetical protein HYZ28_28355 [Myxococcales bacterium]|nr:hypothetical protein [Myxococcales bacterium]
MPAEDRGAGRKKPARVEVIHFPKKGKPVLAQAPAPKPSRTQTIPEFRPDEELVTEPAVVADDPAEDAGRGPGSRQAPSQRSTPPWPRTDPRMGAPPKAKDRRKAPPASRRKTPPQPFRGGVLEMDTDPALRYHNEKVEKMLSDARPEEGQPVAPQQVAEMSLFGHHLFESGRLEEARVVFEGLVGMDVADAFPYTMLGTIYLALGDQDRALALFEAGLQIDERDLAARVYRAEIRLNRGKLKMALEDLHRAVEIGLGDDPFVDRAKRLLRLAQEMAARQRR